VEITAASRSTLDTLAQLLTAQGVPQIELRGYANSTDAEAARKLALVRTLAVRMYLINQGVTARIAVAAGTAPKRGSPPDRVDIVTP
jgi:outer membrane protein OmpA-like peptidoglycan-associated protein